MDMSKQRKEAKVTASDYLNQTVIYGGMETTRGAMISDLRRIAASHTNDRTSQELLVTRFLQGFELGQH